MKQLLIIVAFEVEEAAALKEFTEARKFSVGNKIKVTLNELKTNEKTIYLARSGVGPVNTALTVAIITEHIDVDAILLMGVAGALDEKLNIGDAVISNKVIQHDSRYVGEDCVELMAPGQLFVSVDPIEHKDPAFHVNSNLLDWTTNMLQDTPHSIGCIISGNEFVAKISHKEELSCLDPCSLAIDMEAAGLALVSYQLNIPFIVVKTIADRMKPADGIEDDYKNYLSTAADNIRSLIQQIKKS